jgi:hypothetical protein
VSEEHEVIAPGGVDRECVFDRPPAVVDRVGQVLAEVRPEQGERSRGEPRLDDRPFVGESEDDGLVARRRDGRVADGGDRGGRDPLVREPVDDSKDLRRRAAPADRDGAFERPTGRQLGGRIRVGRPGPELRPARRVGLRDEP